MTELGGMEHTDGSAEARVAAWVPENTFADRLARIRRRQGWNFMEAGRATGLSGKSWRLWEQYDRQPYNLLEVATAISEATGCSLYWLLTGDPGPGATTTGYFHGSMNFTPPGRAYAVTDLVSAA